MQILSRASLQNSYQLLIVEALFERYTIVVVPFARSTYVYCEECDMWVAQYDGDQISTNTQDELYEMIVSAHTKDFPEQVDILDDTVSFK